MPRPRKPIKSRSLFGPNEMTGVFGTKKPIKSRPKSRSLFGPKEMVRVFGTKKPINVANVKKIAQINGVKGLKELGLSSNEITKIMNSIKKKK